MICARSKSRITRNLAEELPIIYLREVDWSAAHTSPAPLSIYFSRREERRRRGGAKREVGEELFSLVMLFLPENLGSVSSLEGSRTCSSTQICNTQGTIYREKVTAEQVPDLQFFWLTFGFKESITLFFIVYQESHTVKVCCPFMASPILSEGKSYPAAEDTGKRTSEGSIRGRRKECSSKVVKRFITKRGGE